MPDSKNMRRYDEPAGGWGALKALGEHLALRIDDRGLQSRTAYVDRQRPRAVGAHEGGEPSTLGFRRAHVRSPRD